MTNGPPAPRTLRRVVAAALAVVVTIVGLGSVAAVVSGGETAAAAEVTTLESRVGDALATALPSARAPSISGDGRWLTFDAQPDPDEPRRSVFLRDRQQALSPGGCDGFVRCVTEVPNGATGESLLPSISRDGCSVTFFTTIAYDATLDVPVAGGGWDVYRWTNPACAGGGTVTLVSRGPAGRAVNLPAPTDEARPAVSATGRFVVWVADPGAFAGGAPRGATTLYRTDLENPAQPGVIGLGDPPPGDRGFGAGQPAIDDTGTVIVLASDFDPGTTPAGSTWNTLPAPAVGSRTLVYRWRPGATPPIDLLSAAPNGPAADGTSLAPAVSADGRIVAFASRARNLVTGVTFPVDPVPFQVYTVDLGGTARVVTLLTRTAGGAPGGGDSGVFNPTRATEDLATRPTTGLALSGDGAFVAFQTVAADLVLPPAPPPTDPARGDDLLIANRSTASLARVTVNAAGTEPAPRGSSRPSVNTTGRYTAFESTAGPALLGAPAQNLPALRSEQVYVRDRPPTLVVSAVDFGPVTRGTVSPARNAVVTNSGLSAVRFPVTGAGSTGSTEFTVSASTCTASTLLPGQTCTVSVRFSPTALGARSATLTVTSLGSGVDFQPVSGQGQLTGTGVAPTTTTIRPTTTTTRPRPTTTTTTRPTTTTTTIAPAFLEVDPATLDLGSSIVGTSTAAFTATVRNSGEGPSAISGVSISGDQAAEFVVDGGACLGVSLSVGQSCQVTVRATPAEIGTRTAELVVVGTNDGQAVATLTVTGTLQPTWTANPGVVVVGGLTQLVGSGYPPAVDLEVNPGIGSPFVVTTDGDGSVRVTWVVPAGAPTGTRRVEITDPAGVLPASAATVLVVPAPDGVGLPVAVQVRNTRGG